MSQSTIQATAEAAAQAGLVAFGIRHAWTDTSGRIHDKVPALKNWTNAASPAPEQAREWWGTDAPLGVGILTGSGHRGRPLMFELEGRVERQLRARWVAAVQTEAPSLAAKLGTTWCDQSPSGGHHWQLYLEDPSVLAAWSADLGLGAPKEIASGLDDLGAPQVLAEVIADGRYTVIAPSPGACHKSGQPWQRVAGGPESIQALTVAETRQLLDITRRVMHDPRVDALRPTRAASSASTATAPYEGVSPLRAYSQAVSASAELLAAGWSQTSSTTLCRPGGTNPSGATVVTRDDGVEVATIWTPDAGLPVQKAMDAAELRALLRHDGDRSLTARTLLAEGHGTRSPRTAVAPPPPPPPPPAPSLAIVTPLPTTTHDGDEPVDPLRPDRFEAPHLRYTERAFAARVVAAAEGRLRALGPTWMEWVDGEGWVLATDFSPVTRTLFRLLDDMKPGVADAQPKSTKKGATA